MPIPEAKFRPGDARQKGRKRLYYAEKLWPNLHPSYRKGREKSCLLVNLFLFSRIRLHVSPFFRGKHEPVKYLSNATRPTYAARIDIDTHHG